jgi:hypothetical protein
MSNENDRTPRGSNPFTVLSLGRFGFVLQPSVFLRLPRHKLIQEPGAHLTEVTDQTQSG